MTGGSHKEAEIDSNAGKSEGGPTFPKGSKPDEWFETVFREEFDAFALKSDHRAIKDWIKAHWEEFKTLFFEWFLQSPQHTFSPEEWSSVRISSLGYFMTIVNYI